jgi:enterochelin esterase-like enzyme
MVSLEGVPLPVRFPRRAAGKICLIAFSAVLLFSCSGRANAEELPGGAATTQNLPAVVAPANETPTRIAAFSGVWDGTWSDGKRTTLVVYRLERDKAYVLHRFEASKGALAWNGWARAAVVDGDRPRLEWKNSWSQVSVEFSADGKELIGTMRETARNGEVKSSVATMTFRPGVQRISAQAGRPQPCPESGRLLQQIVSEKNPAQRATLVEALTTKVRAGGAPLVESSSRAGQSCATFFYRGIGSEVAISGAMNGDSDQKDFLTRVGDTDLFFFSQEYPSDARVEYELAVDGKHMPDPFNPHVAVFGRGSLSEARMPGYRPPPEVLESPSIPKGVLEELVIASDKPDMSRTVTIYLPYGYAESGARYPVLYLNDGFGVLKFGKIATILDNLIAQKAIPPTIAVLLPSVKDRIAEYAMNPVYEAFMIDDALPAIDRRYRTLADPAHRVVGGGSAGAVAALSLALRHPELFGKCMAQSTATKPDVLASLIALAESAPQRPIRVYLDVGSFEADYHGTDLRNVSERLRSALLRHNCLVHYKVVNEGHGWNNWRSRTGEALQYLLGAPTE